MKKLFSLFTIMVLFVACDRVDEQEQLIMDKLVNKHWVRQGEWFESYTFTPDKNFLKAREISSYNPITQQIETFNDTLIARWDIQGNCIVFKPSGVNDVKAQPTDWKVLNITDSVLEVKFVADADNTYILPTIFNVTPR